MWCTTDRRKYNRKKRGSSSTGACSLGGIKILSLDIIAGGRDHFGDHFEVGITTIYKITITGVVRTFDSSNLTVRDVMGGGKGRECVEVWGLEVD